MGMELFPALKAKMGKWEYYIIKMRMSDLYEIKTAREIHEDDTLGDAVQRVLDESRVKKDIIRYLSNQEERFFGSIVVASLGGEPKWYGVDISDDPRFEVFKDQNMGENYGLLSFNGDQTVYALDGQHRLRAVQELLREDQPTEWSKPVGFEDEEMSVLMIVRRDKDEAFLQSYRRLFTSLNRNAKATDADTNIIMDEDDAFAIVTRELITQHSHFAAPGREADSERVQTKSKNIRAGSSAFTSLQSLYEMTKILLWTPKRQNELGKHDAYIKQLRPDDETIKRYNEEISTIWNALIEVIPDLKNDPRNMRSHNVKDIKDKDLQDEWENMDSYTDNMLFTPIGQAMLARVVRRLLNQQLWDEDDKLLSQDDIVSTLSSLGKIDWNLHAAPWRYLVLQYNPEKDQQGDKSAGWSMASGARNEAMAVAEQLVMWLSGYLEHDDNDLDHLEERWRKQLVPLFDEGSEMASEVAQLWQDTKSQYNLIHA